MKPVLTKSFNDASWKNRQWGVEHLPIIESESMEMHLKKVLPNSCGTPHIHHYETLYYVIKGEIISISGENLENISVQKAGSFVWVPQGTLHTVLNIQNSEAISVVTHNRKNITDECTIFNNLEPNALAIFNKLKNTINIPS
ncbi:cupin domain-containing protein [Thiotrichales bacterium 19S3-7]|nr:cupin domain-containing protein [Thiotrichales bacterium 19S3-7]MCF6802860.1 cupin domain-containing protein [Thiotrichales bacterium 19S3-11]